MSNINEVRGFWSYVHDDDMAENGRITQLAKDVEAQYGVITGESLHLFVDRKDLNWGDLWRSEIEKSIAAGTFFIPVLTPRYFNSPECRNELRQFTKEAQQLGVERLVLPILWVSTPLLDGSSDDEDANLVSGSQWEDWTETRFEEKSSSLYRRAVYSLAQRLAETNRFIEDTEITPTAPIQVQDNSDELGTLDKLVNTEVAIPEWTQIIEDIGKEITSLQPYLTKATSDLELANSQHKNSWVRLRVFQNLAKELEGPAFKIQSLSKEYINRLYSVDQGIKTIFEMISRDESGKTEEEFQAFFDDLMTLVKSSKQSSDSVEDFLSSIGNIEHFSKDLRKPLRVIRHALASMLEANKIIDEWAEALTILTSKRITSSAS